MNLDIKKLTAGICFVCREPTADPEAYLHGECARAYSDEKMKRIADAWMKEDAKKPRKNPIAKEVKDE